MTPDDKDYLHSDPDLHETGPSEGDRLRPPDGPSINKPTLFSLVRHEQFANIFVVAIALLWVSWLLLAITGIDVLDFVSDEPGDSVATPMGLFIVASALTLLLGPLATMLYRRTYNTLTRGIGVECEVTKKSKYGKAGMIDVTLRYTHNGKTYTPTRSVARETADRIRYVVIDPEKPKRFIIPE